MDLSIIIVSWQVKDRLQECLSSLYRETRDLNFEVIVIDNHSSDGTVAMVKKNFPQADLLTNSKNLGFAAAVNQGLILAQGRYILLLNPDVIILNKAICMMLAFMEQQPDCGISGCRLLNSDGSLQPSVRLFPSFFVHLIMMFKLHHFFPLNYYLAKDFIYTKVSEVEQVMGAFFLLRREVLEKVGLFDEKFYLWFDEVDYCLRAKKAAFKVFYTSAAEVIHYGGQSFRQTSPLKKQWFFSLSRLHYLKKHSHIFAYLIIFLLTPFSLFLTLINQLFKLKNAD